MSRTFVLIDIYNLFFRAMYAIGNNSDESLQDGLLYHTMITMIKNACDKFQPNHLVMCSDGNKSWRKQIFQPYKANRLNVEKSPKDIMREEHLKNIFTNELLPFFKEKTNISFLSYPMAEADDLIARFISLHPQDNIIILSTDNDFVQLLSNNVIIYNSMEERIISKDCMISSLTKEPIKFGLKDGKVSVSKTDYTFSKSDTSLVPMKDWVEYALFTKCIRGDKSDNIFSAYPRVRESSTKNKIGMYDAFIDRTDKGYNWQSFMNSTWEDPMGKKHIVKEEYEFNKKLIDLKMIPEDLKEHIDNHIKEVISKEPKKAIGMNVARFLQKHELIKLYESVHSFSSYFSQGYPNK